MEANLKREGEDDDTAAPNVKRAKVDLKEDEELEIIEKVKSKEDEELKSSEREKSKEDEKLESSEREKIKEDDNDVDSSVKDLSSANITPLSEEQVGISEYMGSHSGFSAIIKQRYSDFIVNEVDLDGKVVHLTQMSYDEKQEEENEEVKEDGNLMKSFLSQEDISAIETIAENKDMKATYNIKSPEDKELRTKIHLAVKKSHAELETKTVEDEDGNKVIQVLWRKGKSRRDFDWPQSKKAYQYVRFVLYKENKDTMDVIGLIAKNLRVKESLFQYAGTKDKRAKTCQEVTVHRVHPKKLCGLNKVLWNIGFGNFRYVQEPLKLGQLSGNCFSIVLRNVQKSQEFVDQCLSSFQSKGFINYFGMQRFGTTTIPTHQIGRAVLLEDWDEVIDLILKPRGDMPVKDKFQQVWAKTRDADSTLKVTPRFCGIELKVLTALSKKMKAFNAFEKLPRNTRLMYIHSYQSYIWNRMVSRRLKQMGHQVVVGDLVMPDSKASSPVVVTMENLHEFSLQNVVLPLPGFDVVYPSNEVAEWYRDLMKEDGLDIDQMKRPQKDYSLSGAYRHLVVIAKDVAWSHHSYDDYTQPLTLSDFDVLKDNKLPTPVESGKYQAATIQFSLPTSTYATMALREIMKIDTSSFHQTSLNVT